MKIPPSTKWTLNAEAVNHCLSSQVPFHCVADLDGIAGDIISSCEWRAKY